MDEWSRWGDEDLWFQAGVMEGRRGLSGYDPTSWEYL